mgnify:FL=1
MRGDYKLVIKMVGVIKMARVRKNLYWNENENVLQNDNIFKNSILYSIETVNKGVTQNMLTKGDLETLHRLSKIRGLTEAELSSVFTHAINQQSLIDQWYQLLMLISRSGSSWSTRIREVLDQYHFGTADNETINAVKTLLQKHAGSSVETVLQLLARLDTPLKHNIREPARRSGQVEP